MMRATCIGSLVFGGFLSCLGLGIPRVLATESEAVLSPPKLSEAPRWAGRGRGVDPRGLEPMGGGGGVASLRVFQTGYLAEDGVGLFWLTWIVNGLNTEGITLFANGIPVVYIGTGIPVVLGGDAKEAEVIAEGDVWLGPILFEVVAEGAVAQDSIEALARQPFDNPSPFTCKEGPRDPETGTCGMILEPIAGRQPEFYRVQLDGTDLENPIPGGPSSVLPGVTPGHHCVTVVGWNMSGGNDYLGDPVETCCDISCTDLACDAPYSMAYCQTAFGPGPTNEAVVTWRNGEPDYAGIEVLVDAQPLRVFPGDGTELRLTNLEPGEHTLTLVGDCGEKGKSEPAVLAISITDVAPTSDPLRDLTCKFTTPSAQTLTAFWKNLTVAQAIDVFLIDPQDQARLMKTLPGGAASVIVEGAVLTDRLGLKFSYQSESLCYSSSMQVCTPEPPPGYKYLLADCDGNSNVDITDAIFSLNRLFKGGAASRCELACDTSQDGRFNLSDVMFTLLHLFQGGPPPAGNYPGCNEAPPGSASCLDHTCLR